MSTGEPALPAPGVRRFGTVNWRGAFTLAAREVRRFMAVWQQTLFAPLITAALFLTVFGVALGQGRTTIGGLGTLQFLAPGILMMTVVQNAFANTSSSIMSAKVQGNIVDTLMPPLSAAELLAGYLAGSVARAALVALVILAGLALGLGIGVAHPGWMAAFVLMAALLLGGLGVIAGIMAQKFDQMAAVTNFVITPLSFLSGTFYSVEALPPAFRAISRANPVFYLINGARHGMTGASDADPRLGLAVCGGFTVLVLALCWAWLRSGTRLKP